RTSLSTARHPVWLRVMGPIVVSTPVSGPSDETACSGEGARSLRFEIPDLGERVRTEFACLTSSTLDEGDAVVLVDLRSGEVACAGVGPEGRFRLQVPASEGDPLALAVYDRAADRLDAATCTFEGEEPRLDDVIETWRSANGPMQPGRCPTCARYREQVFE